RASATPVTPTEAGIARRIAVMDITPAREDNRQYDPPPASSGHRHLIGEAVVDQGAKTDPDSSPITEPGVRLAAAEVQARIAACQGACQQARVSALRRRRTSVLINSQRATQR